MEKLVFDLIGMHCESCAKVIEMDLEEAGFEGINADFSTNKLSVPAKYANRVKEIAAAVAKSGSYSLVTNK